MEKHDMMIWRKLVGGGYVKRRYFFTGRRCGRRCRFTVELEERRNNETFIASAVSDMNVWYCCHDYVNVRDLAEITKAQNNRLEAGHESDLRPSES